MREWIHRFFDRRFPLDNVTRRFFCVALIALTLLAGMDQGLLILMDRMQIHAIIQAHLGLFYWLVAAFVLTLFMRSQIKKHYEEPARRISDAAAKIAGGDFSVRVDPVHAKPEDQDFFDETILDINRMSEELGSIETLKTDFISNVSHEMKTPLAVIKNNAQLLLAQHPDEDTKRSLQVINENAGRMADLITDILRLNRIENQKIVPNLEKMDVSRQLTDCLLQFEDTWEKKQIDIDVDVEDSCRLLSDEGLLEHVWMNLLSNAFKFTEAGGMVSVRQYSDEKTITVEIRDTGCGMDEDTARHIFDKFYQGDTSRSTEGNGLGLALVQRILKLLHGDISVTSKPGEGSTFSVVLSRENNG